MKLGLCIGTLYNGGAERQMALMANLFAERGHNVTLITTGDVEDDYFLNEKVKRVRIAPGKSPKIKFIQLCFHYWFTHYDGIISFLPGTNYYTMIANYFHCSKRTKLIMGERNALYGKNENKYLNALIFRGLYNKADFIVPNSITKAKQLIEINPKWVSKIRPILNYTEIDKIRVQTPPFNKVPKIGIFGRYNEQKNCVRFAQMVAKLRNDYPDLLFEVYWHGHLKDKTTNDYSPHYIAMKKVVEDKMIQDTLHLCNFSDNVMLEMSEYDAICLPSLYEGFSNSIAEAICAGKPMLVSDVSDNSTMVHNAKNGFLFNPESIDSMEKAFVDFLSLSQETVFEMGRQSRLIAESIFDKEKFINSYLELLQ